MVEPARYCDLVMKGGITSGLVYPQAVLELAKRYRFKNIGGTSAGAIAAAVCAAAALGERRKMHDPALAGRNGLGMAGLAVVAGQMTRQGFIAGLFQPIPAARAAYRMIVTLAAKPGLPKMLGAIALGLIRMGWPGIGLALVVLLGIPWLFGVVPTLPSVVSAAFCALAIGVVWTVRGAAAAASGNFLGLCPGIRQPGARVPALTDWMHDTIRTLAGLDDPQGNPVTFGDLWGAPAYPDEPGDRRLNLQIITTNVSNSEPRTLPFAGGGLFFREDEFRRLFPPTVLEWLKAHSPSTVSCGGQDYLELPTDRDMPIVVAARMSLSFPLLISAIPLHERDFVQRAAADASEDGATAGKGERPRLADSVSQLLADSRPGAAAPAATFSMRCCWFTDGGVSSNFPIHLFDSALPRWPTFAIDLVYAGTGQIAQPIFLPMNNNQGLRPRYQAITGKGPLKDVSAFLFGIIGTMQNWRDLLQGRAPGHRDRIVRILLSDKEGGMNLDMPQKTLDNVAQKGGLAGQELVNKFDFNNHFWVRYRNAASAIERFTISFGDSLAPPLTPDNRQAWDRMWKTTSVAGPYRLKAAQARVAVDRLQTIQTAAAQWKGAAVDLTEGAPKPLPQLRIVPVY